MRDERTTYAGYMIKKRGLRPSSPQNEVKNAKRKRDVMGPLNKRKREKRKTVRTYPTRRLRGNESRKRLQR